MIYNFVLSVFKYFESKSSEPYKSKTKHAHPEPKKVIKKQSLLTLLEKNESQTPILNIMNCLSTKELARMSMVSKAVKDISDGILQTKANIKIMDIYCENACTIVKTKHPNGKVRLFGRGSNTHGQLGLGDKKNIKHFKEIPIHLSEGEEIDNLIFGSDRTIITVNNGDRVVKILGCGANNSYQLGCNMPNISKIKQFTELFEVPNEGDQIENVICGKEHTITTIKKADESIEIFGCGSSWYRQLQGSYDCLKQFRKIHDNLVADYQIDDVFCGDFYTLIKLKDSNKIFGCGSNEYGQLGHGSLGHRDLPTRELLIQLNAQEKINDIFCSNNHIIISVMDTEGQYRLIGCGNNIPGQLGLGERVPSFRKAEFENIPVPLNPDEKIEKVMVKPHHTIIRILNTQGSLKILGCGYNHFGQLGFGERESIRSFEELPIPLNDGEKIENIFSGENRTFVSVRNTDGQIRILGCGDNKYGQLGLDSHESIKQFIQLPMTFNKDDQIDHIICAYSHTIINVKDSKGNLKIYGSGQCNQLGLVDGNNLIQFERLPIKGQILESIDQMERAERLNGDMRP